MRWTIGLPSYDNFTEVYFTVQSLRLHHDLTDCEIVVVDNFGDKKLEDFCKSKGGLNNWNDFHESYPDETANNFKRLIPENFQGESNKGGIVRYDKFNLIRGVSPAKNRIFEIARGDYVLCMDSHILIKVGALDVLPPGDDLVQGPCFFNAMQKYSMEWLPQWRGNMWGIWAPSVKTLPDKPFEIWGMGAGFFCCKRSSWLGFNAEFRGFGGESGYIQEKYRQAGRRVWCDPSKVWVHLFSNGGRKIPFPIPTWERIRNYALGFRELGLDVGQIKDHFEKNNMDGKQLWAKAMAEIPGKFK